MTPKERAAIGALHFQDLGPMRVWCKGCGDRWPCDASRLLSALTEYEAALVGYLATDGSCGMFDALLLAEARERALALVSKDAVLVEEDRLLRAAYGKS